MVLTGVPDDDFSWTQGSFLIQSCYSEYRLVRRKREEGGVEVNIEYDKVARCTAATKCSKYLKQVERPDLRSNE